VALVGQLLDKGFPAKLLGSPDGVWVMAGPYSSSPPARVVGAGHARPLHQIGLDVP